MLTATNTAPAAMKMLGLRDGANARKHCPDCEEQSHYSGSRHVPGESVPVAAFLVGRSHGTSHEAKDVRQGGRLPKVRVDRALRTAPHLLMLRSASAEKCMLG